MKSLRDERKPMDPLFPRLHVNDADKGGPRAPPRNKMAFCEQYNHNVSSQSPRYNSGSMKILTVPSSNGCSTSVPQASSSYVGNPKQKLLPTFFNLPGSSYSGDIYHSCYSGRVSLHASLTKSEPRISATVNNQKPGVSGNSMMTIDCKSSQPCNFSSCSNYHVNVAGDGNDFSVPSFILSNTILNHVCLPLHLDKEEHTTFSSVSTGKRHDSCLKQPKETIYDDQSRKCRQNCTEKLSKLSQNIEDPQENPVLISLIVGKTSADAVSTLAGNKISDNVPDELSLVDESTRLLNSYEHPLQKYRVRQESKSTADVISEMPETNTRKRCASETEDSACSFSRCGDNGLTKIERAGECSEDKDSGAMQLGSTDKKQEISDTSMADSISSLHLTPDDVAGVIGQRLFWKARRTIVHQQRIFAIQIFELHRLIKVQRLIAASPEVLCDNNFNLDKPSIKFPPMNKLLFVTPLDSSLVVAKPKLDTIKSNPDRDLKEEVTGGKLPEPIINAEKRQFAQLSTAKTSTTPASILMDTKQAPWCFHPPPGNQWLVPVKSPSEGLIYKPYTGPCPPTIGFMAPVYGNHGPISLNTICATAYGVPAPTHHGIGRSSGPALEQSYFQQFVMPLINASGSNLEVKPMNSLAGPDKSLSTRDANVPIPCQSSCNVPSQQSGILSDCGGTLHGSKGSDMQGSSANSPTQLLQGDVLSLFPTMPLLHVSKESCNEPRVQVIKVVPHNPKSATESAARIFQSIQEERRKNE